MFIWFFLYQNGPSSSPWSMHSPQGGVATPSTQQGRECEVWLLAHRCPCALQMLGSLFLSKQETASGPESANPKSLPQHAGQGARARAGSEPVRRPVLTEAKWVYIAPPSSTMPLTSHQREP